MKLNNNKLATLIFYGLFIYTGCKIPAVSKSPQIKNVPDTFINKNDTTNSAAISWRNFFNDSYLVNLIDTALKNNQELAITLQEIEIAKNEIGARKSFLYPRVEAGVGIGIEKVGRFTSQGAGDASTDITEGKIVPEWLPDYRASVFASWEADVWKKLRNSKKAAINRYLATIEGKNFVITNLVGEIAAGYYELLALDNQLSIVKQTILLQSNALEIVKVQKQAARATELAVKKFEAEVLNSKAMEFDLQQKIQAKENEINYLVGRYPQSILRDTNGILKVKPLAVTTGIPSQLLQNRPDVKQAELALQAAKLDVKIIKAEFYPSFNITAALGLQAFNPSYIARLPESLLSTFAGDMAGPLINKAAIKAEYAGANARKIQALYEFERRILNGYIEVRTQLSNMENYHKMYELKEKETDTLVSSINIAADLFRSARADYLEVLMTQRDALETKLELVEVKLKECVAASNIYKALGGGWK